MFTVVATPTRLSLDEHFIKRPAATFFVTVEGDGRDEQGIRAGDTLTWIAPSPQAHGPSSLPLSTASCPCVLSLPWIGEDACVWGVVSGRA